MALVLGFGAVTIDDLIYVDRPLSAGKGKVTAGSPTTAATWRRRSSRWRGSAGEPASSAGSATDRSTIRATGELERQGVDISLAPRRADARSIRSVITVAPDGERFIAYDDEVPHGTSAALADAALARGGCC